MTIMEHAIIDFNAHYECFMVYELIPNHPTDEQFIKALREQLPKRIPGQMEDGKAYLYDKDDHYIVAQGNIGICFSPVC